MKTNLKCKRLVGILLVIMIVSCMDVFAQRIRVQGHITNPQGKSVPNVNVLNPVNDERIEMSDEDGRYSVLVEKNGSLKFTCIGYEDKTVKVAGKQILDVVLKDAVIELDEVTITTKVKNKVIPEPTDIEIKGNYFHLKTRVPVPKEMFNSHRRLVLQPSIYDVTRGERLLMRPVVFDGSTYNTTQRRMYDSDIEKDPLHEYIRVKTTSSRKGDVIAYHDSIYIEYLQDDYRADVHLAMENYRNIIYRDSFSIARGTINPLRFLEYKFSAFNLTDKKYLPKPVMQLRDTKGEVNLTFLVGKADLDDKNPQNQVELSRLNKELHAIETNPDASLKSFHITGVASPDGSYESNLRLAKLRTDKALERILSQLDSETRKILEVKSDASVASWKEVVELLKKDSRQDMAKEVEDLIRQYEKIPYRLHQVLKSKPFYKEIAATYLPKLRKVQYTYGYSVFRSLTDEEIRQLYRKNPKELTRFEYYRMIAITKNPGEREKYCREALELYENFTYAANELAVATIQKDAPDSKILEPFISKSAPVELLSNQAIALLHEGKYTKADSILALVPEEAVSDDLQAIVQALAGYYDDAFEKVAATGPLNEVVMLLAMKRNQEAWDKISAMNVKTAREYYVKAIAANRLEKVGEAIMSIEKALELDPTLLETARVDGDIIDLLPEEQKIKNDNTTKK
ncbi:tetratricopeptide repeat protein [uncultured Bacteroides sp.]|uniref:tetratricopeptide repeat protein n=1 Tax=uncultured Bacteroides sp. TaxID=162156 RepID=UPI00267464D3|nr:carboxypeptidase-like regulatory domain-containing protein [uncultured Bacteroides sp.]